jgi:hypothetical protein
MTDKVDELKQAQLVVSKFQELKLKEISALAQSLLDTVNSKETKDLWFGALPQELNNLSGNLIYGYPSLQIINKDSDTYKNAVTATES